MNAVTAHQEVRRSRRAILKGQGDLLRCFIDRSGFLTASKSDVVLFLYRRKYALQGITTSDTECLAESATASISCTVLRLYLVWWVADSLSFRSLKAALCKLARIYIKDLEEINRHSIVSFSDDGQCSEVVEEPEGIGCQVDSSADGGL